MATSTPQPETTPTSSRRKELEAGWPRLDEDLERNPTFDPDLSRALDAIEVARQALDMAQAAIERRAGL